MTVKADAATRLFSLSCRTLCWAVLDSGIDATHPAFARRTGDEPLAETPDGLRARRRLARSSATYDFTKLRALLAKEGTTEAEAMRAQSLDEINQRLLSGRAVDWSLLLPLHRGPQGPLRRRPPTSTARTSRACWPATGARQRPRRAPADHDVQGVCPDMELYDLRVFDADGAGDEFAILAALQYVRWLNANASAPVIHGVNLSLSLDHEVGAYACGRTPVCDECERLIGSGTVVVAAAGNEGRAYYSMASGTAEGYRQISITDPGNADGVHHGRRHPPPPAPHLRRLLLLEPRADRRRPPQARPRRAGREDHGAGARTSGSRASTARAWPRRTSPARRRC